MLVASFSADTAWAGRTITHDQGRFVLQGFGAISAAQVLEYDRVTPLLWSTGGTRAWVRSLAHREGGAVGAAVTAAAPTAAAPAAAAASPAPPPAAVPATHGADPGVSAPGRASRPLQCHFARAHYVGGQPSLGPSLDGSMLVTSLALAVSGGGGGPGPSISLTDVVSVSLYAGQVLARSGLTASISADGRTLGARSAEDRTFLVTHLRPRGYEAFALDGVPPDDVRQALAPVLAEAGVRLEGRAPSGRPSPVTDEVQRLAELHVQGSLTDDEFRASLGPVFTGAATTSGEEPSAARAPSRMPDAVKEAALDRLSQLRLSGAITDAELAAMRAKLLE